MRGDHESRPLLSGQNDSIASYQSQLPRFNNTLANHANNGATGDSSCENGGEESSRPLLLRPRSNTINSLISSYEVVKRNVDKKKFGYLLLLSLSIYLGFVTLFAPRTSLSRDFRRWHSSKLTTAEIYRIYLNSLQENNLSKKHIDYYSKNRLNIDNINNYIIEQFRDLGLTPHVESYYPWISYPIDIQVKLFENDTLIWDAPMIEDCLLNSTSNSTMPTALFKAKHNNSSTFISSKGFHSYSPNGNVTAGYVYCNYGSLEDYKILLDNDINIEGKIHIIRYGNLNQGLKVKNAELYGASSVILYTDPYDDGLITTENGYIPYPAGPARNPSAIERGSVEFFTDFPGDPTTPGYASKYRDIERLSPVGKIPRIPSAPMSPKDITPILNKLNGKGIKLGISGNIDGFDYFTGPSDENVNMQLVNQQNYSIVEMKNIIVEIPGIFSEGETIIGSYRDSWSFGNVGNSASSTAILLEIARGLSTLLNEGWKPLRPIRLVSWDGEDHGLIGSTEYVEDHASKLKRDTLTYLNIDNAITGSEFKCESNPLLHQVIYDAAKYTNFKGKEGTTLYDEWLLKSNATISPLRGNSDYVPFQYHLGIPSAAFSFSQNKSGDAIHHTNSLYDSVDFIEKFVDPDYKLHSTLSSITGLTALMVSESELNTFKTHSYFKEINYWYDKLHHRTLEIFPHDSQLHKLADTVDKTINILLSRESLIFDKKTRKLNIECTRDYPVWSFMKKFRLYLNLLRTNEKLKQIDRLFVSNIGLMDRDWMKHSVFAPNKYTGEIGSVLPGIFESVEELNRDELYQKLTLLLTQLNNIRFLLK